MQSAPNTDCEDEVLTYACYVRRPLSTYEFGVWAWSHRREGSAAGTAAFEVFDGGFNDCSEVLYADLLFVPGGSEGAGSAGSGGSEGAIVVRSFFAVDFDDQGDATREKEMNPTVFPLLVRALLRMHPGFGRVEAREEASSTDGTGRAGSADSAEASPLMRALHETFGEPDGYVSGLQPALLRPLYAVLGAREPGAPDESRDSDEDDAALLDRVRREMWEVSEAARNRGSRGSDRGSDRAGEAETLFARAARADAARVRPWRAGALRFGPTSHNPRELSGFC